MAKFGRRKLTKTAFAGSIVTTPAVVVASKPSSGGGSAEKKPLNRFAEKKRAKLPTSVVTALNNSEHTVGMGSTPAAKGGAAALIDVATDMGASLGKRTAYFTALKGVDVTLLGLASKLPTVKAEFTWLTKVPFIGSRLTTSLQEEQGKWVKNGMVLALYGLAVSKASDVDELSTDADIATANAWADKATALEDMLALDGSSVLLDQGLALYKNLTDSFESLTDVSTTSA